MNLYIAIKHLDIKKEEVLYSIVFIFLIYSLFILLNNALDNLIIKHLLGLIIVFVSFAGIIRILLNHSKKIAHHE
jgi:hypothetical protein